MNSVNLLESDINKTMESMSLTCAIEFMKVISDHKPEDIELEFVQYYHGGPLCLIATKNGKSIGLFHSILLEDIQSVNQYYKNIYLSKNWQKKLSTKLAELK